MEKVILMSHMSDVNYTSDIDLSNVSYVPRQGEV
jgi:hypothetical protein